MRISARSLWAEFLGTALLLFVIVGSGIAVEQLGGDGSEQLLAHAVAVGAALGALIALFASVSGAHFNPAVTMGFWLTGSTGARTAIAYCGAQVLGAIVGVVAANATFGESFVAISDTSRSGLGKPVAEFIATFVLVLLILGLVKTDRKGAVPLAVGGWVAAIVLATASTGFANPAVTIARALTDTFTGIAPASAPAFLLAQFLGGASAAAAASGLFSARQTDALEALPTEGGTP